MALWLLQTQSRVEGQMQGGSMHAALVGALGPHPLPPLPPAGGAHALDVYSALHSAFGL